MNILVTGAAGFVGSRLIAALLGDPIALPSGSRVIAADRAPCPIDDPRIEQRVGSIEDPAFADALVDAEVTTIFHLAAVLSGESETDFDLGFRVNVDATRRLLERCRALGTTPRFVFTSTCAVFGGELPPVVPEDFILRPQVSYGTEKVIAELLVAEYSRKGFVDGVACRLPTVAVRPGAPNSALTSFVSGIIREPVAGVPAVCPVSLDLPLWISSPTTVVRNLIHASRIDTADLGARRAFTLPGLTATAGEMLDSLERFAGPEARALVRHEPDDLVNRIVSAWPGDFDVSRQIGLGFVADVDVDAIVGEYVRSQRPAAA
jgi:nucleoside-diphosphate-sugar epimerase